MCCTGTVEKTKTRKKRKRYKKETPSPKKSDQRKKAKKTYLKIKYIEKYRKSTKKTIYNRKKDIGIKKTNK